MQNDNDGFANNNGFANDLQTVRNAFDILSHNAGDIGELIDADLVIPPHVVGQILMTTLPIANMNERLTTGQKTYWMEVADHMGPDFIPELRKIAAFMDKVDQF